LSSILHKLRKLWLRITDLPGHERELLWLSTKQCKWSFQVQEKTKYGNCGRRVWTQRWHSKLQRCKSKSVYPSGRLCSKCYCFSKHEP